MALREFREAADLGDARAQFKLGMMYKNGNSVARNYGEAIKWYRLAADQGDVKTQFNLGQAYLNGKESVRTVQKRRCGLAKRPSRASQDHNSCLATSTVEVMAFRKILCRL